jgi:D-alanine-D-alanine ligase
MTQKLRVGLLFGGRSAEHEVSLLSAKNVLRAFDLNKYEVVLIGVDKEGRWQIYDPSCYLHNPEDPKKIALAESQIPVSLKTCRTLSTERSIDVIFPLLHGAFGEDGAVQGLLRLIDLPFVGASVLGSAIGMDKEITKRLLREAGLPVANFIVLRKHQQIITYAQATEKLGRELFIKPSNGGSSVGVTKVRNATDFAKGLQLAFEYDRKVLIEQAIDGREIECAVIGNEQPQVSIPGEVFHRCDFYTYEAKYIDAEGTSCEIPAKLSPQQTLEVQRTAVSAYCALNCEGMARVDMFLTPSGTALVNEINTIPGCTYMSPFPRLWEASGVSYPDLLDRLIHFAIDRHQKEKQLKTHYEYPA